MNKRKWGITASVLLLCVVGAWAFGLFGGTDPAVAKLQELSAQMSDANSTDAQRDQLRDQFRQQLQAMTEDQRRSFFDANRGQWMARSAQRMDEFFAMPKAEQQKRLDEIINRMNQPRDNQRQNAKNGRGGRAGMTEAQREERSKRRLDSTSPRTRAQFAQFRKMLDQRAQQRGVKLGNGGGPGFGRGA